MVGTRQVIGVGVLWLSAAGAAGCLSDQGQQRAERADAVAPLHAEAAKPGAGRSPSAPKVAERGARTVHGAQRAEEATQPPTAQDLIRFSAEIPGKGALVATIQTTMGDVHCALFEDVAPMTVANFVGLSTGLKAWISPHDNQPRTQQPLYDDAMFHRVIPGFVIQAGDPWGAQGQDSEQMGMGMPGYQFADEALEASKFDKPGLLAMANKGPDTNGSQFFITTHGSIPHINGRYTVFGQCQDLDIIHAIAQVPRDKRDKPIREVRIKHVEISRQP